jgi:NAD(P)H-hydrate epimerase
MFARLPCKPALARSPEEFNAPAAQQVYDCDLLIDAILGTGFRPPVTGLYAHAIQRFRAAHVPIIAIDIPSGLDADAMQANAVANVVPAGATVTFTAPRPAHVFSSGIRGTVVVAPIGSPEEAVASSLNLSLTTPLDLRSAVAPRRPEAHKGDFGHALVIGGSRGKAGAAAMAGMAALRAGAGLVTVAVPASILATVAAFAPELMTEPLPETAAGTISLRALDGALPRVIRDKTVLAIGPGISRNPETSEVVRQLIQQYPIPTVLDADGLNAFEGRDGELQHPALVLTPHPGEMARLTATSTTDVQNDRINAARRLASAQSVTVVLKGHRTLIAEANGHVWINSTGNPGMATGGMGDILTGLVAGVLSQTVAQQARGAQAQASTAQAVAAAVYLHGLAGDVACEAKGEHCLIATDLLDALPEAFRRTRFASNQPLVRFSAAG